MQTEEYNIREKQEEMSQLTEESFTHNSSIELLGAPLVSVIVCTYNRNSYLHRALKSILAQDTKKTFEVIVVDDGSDSPINLSRFDPNPFRFIQMEHKGVGAARAAGLEAAKGTYIAYCDDDDEWKPNHLSTLLDYMLKNPEVDVVYSDSEWAQAGKEPSVPYSIDFSVRQLSYTNYIFPTDVLHKKNIALEAGGYNKSLLACEDWDLWLRLSDTAVLRHLAIVLAIHHWTESCVSASDVNSQYEWVYNKHQERLEKLDPAVVFGLIQTGSISAPFDPDTWQKTKNLIWHSILWPDVGYGTVGRKLLLETEAEGVDITFAPSRNQLPEGFERFYKPLKHFGSFAFCYDFRLKPSLLKFNRIINYSMWESTIVPKDRIDDINKAVTLQYVPCTQNINSFRECGVRVPIKILHHGVDSNYFPLLQRDNPAYFTFGSFGDFSPRKGIDVLIRAFQDEFHPREEVRLLLKTSNSVPSYNIYDKRISLISSKMNQESLLNFLQQMNVFVLPSRGEGFGLTGLEAMSTGLPLIATNWSGPVEYIDDADSFPLHYKLEETGGAKSNQVFYHGRWAEPDYEHLRFLMRWLYEHPEEAKLKGQAAAKRVHEQWTWKRVAKQLIHDLDLLAGEI